MRTWDRLSATFVRGLNRPGKFYDGGGLMLMAAPTPTTGVVRKNWLFRYQFDRRERYFGIGSVRVVSLAEARARANECRKLLAAGIDPLAQRKAARATARAAELQTATFKQCVDGFLASHAESWRGKHLNQWRNSMATYCRSLDGITVAAIDVGMVLRVIEPEWKRAPETMDRVRSRIGEVLGWAQARNLRPPGPLPTQWKGVLDKLLPHPRSIKPVVHHAAMRFDAVPDLFAKLVSADAAPEQCLAFLMLTATRSQEARGARWDEIDLKNKIWVVPPSRMKRSREHRVPLSAEAVALVKRLPRAGEFLFTVNGNSKPIVAMSLRSALHRHGGDGFTVHGMRSAFRDWGGERTSTPRELLEVALSHAIGNAVETAYARGDLLKKRRRLMQQWATFLATPPARDTEKVVPLHAEAAMADAMADATLAYIIREFLDHPGQYTIRPEYQDQMLRRLLELLEQNQAKRPAHRPQQDQTGNHVAILVECGWPPDRAKRQVAKITKKKLTTVAQAYRRHLARTQRQN